MHSADCIRYLFLLKVVKSRKIHLFLPNNEKTSTLYYLRQILATFTLFTCVPFSTVCICCVLSKNLEEKDGQRQLLYYVSLIRACNKVLYELVYIGKKFVFHKKNLGIQ